MIAVVIPREDCEQLAELADQHGQHAIARGLRAELTTAEEICIKPSVRASWALAQLAGQAGMRTTADKLWLSAWIETYAPILDQ